MADVCSQELSGAEALKIHHTQCYINLADAFVQTNSQGVQTEQEQELDTIQSWEWEPFKQTTKSVLGIEVYVLRDVFSR